MPESLKPDTCRTVDCQVRQFLDQRPWEKKTFWAATGGVLTGLIAIAVAGYQLFGGQLTGAQLGLVATITAGINGVLNSAASLFARQAAVEGIDALNQKVEVQNGGSGS